MTDKPLTIPNWTFEVQETSTGIYRVTARNSSGCTIDLSGVDPDELVVQAKEAARDMEEQLQEAQRTGQLRTRWPRGNR
jgi:hypothetical protein